MSEQEKREVGPAMWGGLRLPSEVAHDNPRRRRPLEAAPEPAGKMVDVRDAAALGMILLGLIGVITLTAVKAGWVGVGILASFALVAGGILLGYRGGDA